MNLDRQDFVLAALSAGPGIPYTPIQVQKLFFLLDENLGDILGGKQFDFQPYDYGPYDKEIYEELSGLQARGLLQVLNGERSMRHYSLTVAGHEQGHKLLEQHLDPDDRRYIETLTKWIQSVTFSKLVSSVYNAYPDMARKSVFASSA